MAANKARIPLAKMAVEETGMGVVEDKVIKNHYASEYIYMPTATPRRSACMEEDPAFGIKKIAEPIGLVAAVIPTTNPTSTAIFQGAAVPQDAQRHPHQSAPARQEVHGGGRAHRLRGGGQGGRAGRHHRLHRIPEPGADGRTDARGGHHPGHRRSRHGARGVFLRQTGAGRRRGQHPGHHRRDARISSWPSARSSIPRRLTTA